MLSISFFVPGIPQPQPKPNPRFVNGKFVGSYHRDPGGKMKAWGRLVANAAWQAMDGQTMLPLGVACRVGVEVRVLKAKSNKRKCPAQRPDWSNYRYYIENIMRKIVYHDDCAVIGPLAGDKIWATDEMPVGAWITVEEVV